MEIDTKKLIDELCRKYTGIVDSDSRITKENCF